MATNRKRTPRSRRETDLNQAQIDWLNSVPYPGKKGSAYFIAYCGGGASGIGKGECGKDLWDQHKAGILEEWTDAHPCTRPARWWEFDAQQEPVPGWPGFTGAQRQRLGGVGTPRHECLNVAPYFTSGLPDSWVLPFEEAYYNGRAKDIHGNLVATQYKEGYFKGKAPDPLDPPKFESQAAYLERHGLLTAEERRHLNRHPELLEPEAVGGQ